MLECLSVSIPFISFISRTLMFFLPLSAFSILSRLWLIHMFVTGIPTFLMVRVVRLPMSSHSHTHSFSYKQSLSHSSSISLSLISKREGKKFPCQQSFPVCLNNLLGCAYFIFLSLISLQTKVLLMSFVWKFAFWLLRSSEGIYVVFFIHFPIGY